MHRQRRRVVRALRQRGDLTQEGDRGGVMDYQEQFRKNMEAISREMDSAFVVWRPSAFRRVRPMNFWERLWFVIKRKVIGAG